mmetsp:Transcript_26965/g.59682  ORF Transcript_26965/g.59682 Transcript_26965/m.59682 type:complete len:221 (-) Transcript_26965:459-1121(-)
MRVYAPLMSTLSRMISAQGISGWRTWKSRTIFAISMNVGCCITPWKSSDSSLVRLVLRVRGSPRGRPATQPGLSVQPEAKTLAPGICSTSTAGSTTARPLAMKVVSSALLTAGCASAYPRVRLGHRERSAPLGTKASSSTAWTGAPSVAITTSRSSSGLSLRRVPRTEASDMRLCARLALRLSISAGRSRPPAMKSFRSRCRSEASGSKSAASSTAACTP